ncbi:MAG TPA: hypothetical protein VGN47_09455 [Blastococcus sp.]|jgi:hypothetical protein|nr:hypothetical protein [Blastococcus sp.]
MLVPLGELVVFVLFLGLLVLGGWYVWTLVQPSGGPGRLSARDRAELATAIERARWAPGHHEADGVTRVLVRRSYTGLDGRPVVLEERVLETFPANDPAWEGLFTEAMSKARFRCQYLNAEESP